MMRVSQWAIHPSMFWCNGTTVPPGHAVSLIYPFGQTQWWHAKGTLSWGKKKWMPNSAVCSQQTSMSLNRIQFLTQKTLLPPSTFSFRRFSLRYWTLGDFQKVIRLLLLGHSDWYISLHLPYKINKIWGNIPVPWILWDFSVWWIFTQLKSIVMVTRTSRTEADCQWFIKPGGLKVESI